MYGNPESEIADDKLALGKYCSDMRLGNLSISRTLGGIYTVLAVARALRGSPGKSLEPTAQQAVARASL